MADLIYSMLVSLDGYTADESGNFDWAAPSDEVHQFFNDLERTVGTYLYGRRMYETMRVWADPEFVNADSVVTRDYAQVWADTDKIVYSSTLDNVTTERTRIERAFDPAAVRVLKEQATADVTIGGPHLAAAALRAGLVDEVSLFVVPYIVGGGTAMLPTGVRVALELAEERRFPDGTVMLRYALPR